MRSSIFLNIINIKSQELVLISVRSVNVGKRIFRRNVDHVINKKTFQMKLPIKQFVQSVFAGYAFP